VISGEEPDATVDRLNEIAARWEHGHDELVNNCALCNGEWAEVYTAIHGERS
jgi:hypothetical protein